MATRKKTLYEILSVAPHASVQDIEQAHARTASLMASKKAHISQEDYAFNLKIIDMALRTLADPMSRAAYDAKLSSAEPVNPAQALALLPQPNVADMRADVMAMRADALSLRADALALRSGTELSTTTAGGFQQAVGKGVSDTFFLLKRAAVIIGVVLAIGMVVQVVFLLFASGRSKSSATMENAASEKVKIQEYYQTYGTRPSSKAEAELLEADARRQENERRVAAEEQKRVADENKRVDEESRRIGRDATREMQDLERQNEQQKKMEQVYEKQKKEEAQRRADQAEQYRIEAEKQKWQEVLRR